MSETKNDEQKAFGARIKPVGWLCVECGTYHDHDKKPDGCKPCESLGEAGDWQPLFGLDALHNVSVYEQTENVGGYEYEHSDTPAEVVAYLTGFRDD
jgi:hypothetical protein